MVSRAVSCKEVEPVSCMEPLVLVKNPTVKLIFVMCLKYSSIDFIYQTKPN